MGAPGKLLSAGGYSVCDWHARMKIPTGHIPDPLDDATRTRFVPSPDLQFRFEVDDAVMIWWRDTLGPHGLYPRELAEALGGRTKRRCTFEFTEFDPVKNHLRLETRGYDGSVQAFFSGRSLEFDRRVIHLNKTTVEEGYKGEGVGSQLLANAFLLARKIEFERLELLAAMDGACVWARAGFLIDPATFMQDFEERLRVPVRERLQQIPRRELDEGTRSILLRLLEQDRADMLWNLVDVARKVTSFKTPPDKIELSWSLLAETEASWYGYLPIGPGKPQDRLLGYLRKKAAIGISS